MSNRIVVYDGLSGKVLSLAREISPEGLRCHIGCDGKWISSTVTGARVDAAYRAFEQGDVGHFGEIMFPTQPEAQEAAA